MVQVCMHLLLCQANLFYADVGAREVFANVFNPVKYSSIFLILTSGFSIVLVYFSDIVMFVVIS